MGCFHSSTRGAEHASNNGELEFTRRRKSSPLPTPEAVQDLHVICNPSHPSIKLSWKPPANYPDPGDLIHYYIKISSKIGNKTVEMEANGGETSVELTSDKLKPLEEYIFAVQAVSNGHIIGDWNMMDGFMDWHCRFPSCQNNRLTLEDGSVYDFCSRDHKIEFDGGYCLFPGCSEPVDSSLEVSDKSTFVRDRSYFCSHDHYYHVLKKVGNVQAGFFIEVSPTSQEYRDVKDHFHTKWRDKKIKCPSLVQVLAIVNHSLNERFVEYGQLHIKDKKTKKFYYGTNLSCDLRTYQVLCSKDGLKDCDVCDLALRGFSRVATSGVTLDKDPWASHIKAQPHEGSQMYGLLMCEVDYGNAKKEKRSLSDSSHSLDRSVDAVRIKKTKSLMRKVTDEIVIYNSDAVCPRYILLYKV